MKTRKILSAFLGLSMALSSLVIPAYADGETNLVIGTVSGEAVAYGETLNVKENGTAFEDDVNWTRVASNGTEEEVGYGTTYIVTEADMGCSIKATTDDDVETEPVAIANMYEGKTFTTNSTYKTNEYSPAKALFKLKNSDKTFVLAKTFNNTESKYFVVANDAYGKKTNNTDKNTTVNGEQVKLTPKYDPTIASADNLFWQVNTELPKNGYKDQVGTDFKLPEEFDSYINYDHIWRTEGTSVWKQNKPDGSGTEDRENMTSYTFTAGVTIPSMTELMTYENIGYSIDCSQAANRWHVRTPVDHSNVAAYTWGLAVYTTDKNGASTNHGWNPAYGVRPEFYLKNGFFANVAIDLASAGDEVIAEIKKQDESALRKLYSDDELKNYLGIIDETATIEIATVSGEAAAYGETMKATVDGEEAVVNWTRVENGTSTVVGTGKTYIVTEADMGCQLKAVLGNSHSGSVSIDTIYTKTFTTNASYDSNADSDPKALFNVKGSDRQFVLAKTFNNDESTYFVVANEAYGSYTKNTNKTIDVGGTSVTLTPKYDPTVESESNFAYWLDRVFPIYGRENKKLPSEIVKYINNNHIWRTEGTSVWKQNKPDGSGTEDRENMTSYTFTAGITIPSMTEITKYDKLGYSIDCTDLGNRYHVRTPVDHANVDACKWSLSVFMNGKEGSSDTRARMSHSENPVYAVRPEFYLKKGFFANVAVDLATAGADVIAEIKKESIVDLVTLYSASEIEDYLGIDVSLYPSIVAVSGEDVAYGETVTAILPTGVNVSDLVWKVDGETITVTDNTHIITEGEAGKKITAEYTKDGKTYTGGIAVPALLNDTVEPNSTVASLKDSPNTFTVDGQEFAIVADFNNSESTFFVAANQTYGNRSFSPDDQTMENITDSLINWLNDDYGFKGGYVEGESLPESITKYIVEHEWLMEAAPKATIAREAKTFTAGISIPSVSELKRYNTTFGWCINPQTVTKDDGTTAYNCEKYWSRTPANYSNSSGKQFQYVVGTPTNDTYKNFNVAHWDLPSSTYLRPVFYLSEDFFRNVAVDDVTELLDNGAILEMLTKRYTANEMAELYSGDYELQDFVDYGFICDGVTVTFTDKDGGALTALNGATSLKANISVSSIKKSFKGVAILALYDGDGTLKNVGTVDLDATATGSDSEVITFAELSGVDAGYTAKVMFWDSLAGMKSISDKVPFGTEVTGATSLAFAEKAESDNSIGGYNFF